ncbi:precorrin-3B synthase [Paraburkholderia sp.]|uniref:precorrin-3B synthase n=1 Tax=Paraburkholderia sp. TaxID=1926495 RepID=UPI003D6FE93F
MNHVSSSAAVDASPALRASACPSLARIVAARDGGLCRIRLPGGELHARDAVAIAQAADLHAAGIVELTSRANLQLRGVRAGHEAALTAALTQTGPGTHDHADERRNLMTSPLAGRDPHALDDTGPLAAALLARLQREPRFAALSPKFALLLDGGERLMAVDHPHDVWLSAMSSSRHDAGSVRYVIGLAGCPLPVPGSALAAVAATDIPAFVDALLHTFLDVASPDDMRMRDVLVKHDATVFLQRAAQRAGIALQTSPAIAAWTRAPAMPEPRIGAHRQRDARLSHVGGQPALGRLDTRTLVALAALASAHGNATLRITPWQSVLVPDIADDSIPTVLDGLRALGLACEPSHPYVRLIACAGSTGCSKSATDTKADARRLATLLPDAMPDAVVHLSGCERSCAAAHCAPHTLLAVAPDHYDLYQRADEASTNANRFGIRIAHHLTIEQAAALLAPSARSHPDA